MVTTILIIVLMLAIAGGIGYIIYTNYFAKRRPPQQNQPKIQPKTQEEPKKEKPVRIESIKDFYDNFNKIGHSTNEIIEALGRIDYESYDRGKLKEFLEHHGYGFKEREEIMDAIYDIFVEKKNAFIIEKEIPHYRNMGWKDDDIRQHFLSRGYKKKEIEDGFKEFHKRNIYNDYIDRIVRHMKKFVLIGKSDSEIIDIFVEHGWPKELLSEALSKTKRTLEEEHSSAFLEEEILKLILAGDNKGQIAKILMRRGWPEDELKHYYDDIKSGLQHFEEELEKVDVNQYNLDKIKESLKRKNWPEPIIERTITRLKQNVEFHRRLNVMKKEAFQMMEDGYNSQQVKDRLEKEGWDEAIVKKIINNINKYLAANDEKEKMKAFNDHIFSKDSWHQHLTESTKGFDNSPQNQQRSEDNNKHELSDLQKIAQPAKGQ